MSQGTPVVEIKNMNLRIAERTLVSTLDLVLKPGSVMTLTGQSGVGKSTLLRSLATGNLNGNSTADSFSVAYGKRDLIYVPQSTGLFPWFSLLKNMQIIGQRFLEPVSKSQIFDIFDKMNLSDIIEKLPEQISGGQYRRAALLPVFFSSRPFVIIDEPLTGVDLPNKVNFLTQLVDHLVSTGGTGIIVSHDTEVLLSCGDRLSLLTESGLTEIAQITPEERSAHLRGNPTDGESSPHLRSLLSNLLPFK
ncbi:MAG: ATP-binding cassette domain-containing protein [Pseudomonadota bacterium]